jgi:hypothetical protein
VKVSQNTVGTRRVFARRQTSQDAQILLGFVRGDSGASACKATKTFYCHAVEWKKEAARNVDGSGDPGKPTNLDFDPFRSDVFVAYYQNTAEDWVAKVADVKIVTAKERAEETGGQLMEMNAASLLQIFTFRNRTHYSA